MRRNLILTIMSCLGIIFVLTSKGQSPTDPMVLEALQALRALEIKHLSVSTEAASTEKSNLAQQGKLLLETIQNSKVLLTMKDMQEELKNAMEDQRWLTKLETMRQIKELLELVLCAKQELSVNLTLVASTDCLSSFSKDLIDADIDLSLDFMNVATIAGLLIEPADRTDMLQDVIDRLKEAHKRINSLNFSIEGDVMTYIFRKSNNLILSKGFGPGRYNLK